MEKTSKLSRIFILILKITVAGALIAWLINKGELDFSKLTLIFEKIETALITLAIWMIGPNILCSLRWHILLVGAGYTVSRLRVLKLNLIGLFFNTAMPGSVGGDLIKTVYIIRDDRGKGIAPALMSAILDRVLGLCGMFTIGFTITILNFQLVLENELLRPIFLISMGFIIFMVFAFFLVRIEYKNTRDPILKILNSKIIGFKILRKLYLALRQYHKHQKHLIAGFILTILNQLILFSFFSFITTLVIDIDSLADIAGLAMVYPVGILITALPISPGGLGVGHIAFEELFKIINLTHGANIFNIFILSQLALNILGVVPYILLETLGKQNKSL